MTIKEALQVICAKQVPKEINGVRTEVVITEEPSILSIDGIEFCIEIAPVEVRRKNAAVRLKYDPFNYEHYKNFDFLPDSSRYKKLERDIEQLLLLYIRNIISYFEEQAIRVIRYDIDDFFKFKEEREYNDT